MDIAMKTETTFLKICFSLLASFFLMALSYGQTQENIEKQPEADDDVSVTIHDYLENQYTDPFYRKFIFAISQERAELEDLHFLLLYGTTVLVESGKEGEIKDVRQFLEIAPQKAKEWFKRSPQIVEDIANMSSRIQVDKYLYASNLHQLFIGYVKAHINQQPDDEFDDQICFYRKVRFFGDVKDSYLCETVEGSFDVLENEPDIQAIVLSSSNQESLASKGASSAKPVGTFEARLGKASEPLNIDGEVSPGEYASGLEIWGLLSDSTGEVSQRTATLYLARDDEGVSMAIVRETHPHIEVDIHEVVGLSVIPPNGKGAYATTNGKGELEFPAGAEEHGLKSAAKATDGKWTVELKIPWSELGAEPHDGEVWHMQPVLQWCNPLEVCWLGLDLTPCAIVMDDDAPGVAARLGSTPPINGSGPQFQWQVTAPKAHGYRVRCEARVQWLGNPESVDATQEIPAGESRMFCLNMTGMPSDPRQMTYTLTDEQGEVLVKREFAWGGENGVAWDDPHPETVFSLATYPTLRLAKARISCAKPALLDQVQSVHFVITDPEERQVFQEVEAPRTPLGFHKQWSLDDLPDGSYLMLAKMIDAKGELTTWKQPFEYRHFAWAGNPIGKERVVIPPFKPLQVDEANNEIHATLTGYRLGEGLFSEVYAEGENILAAPINLLLNGNALSAQGVTWGEISPDRVTATQTLVGDGLEVKVDYDVDYDGFVQTRLEFLPNGETALDSLVLEIPYKTEVATLLHSVAAQLRRNPAIELPAEGNGVIWDSIRDSSANFRPYIWLGGIAKGLGWLCESEKNWSIDRTKPILEVVRQGDSTVLKVHIVSEPCSRAEPFVIEMGFQASPVKPMMPNFRRYSTVAVNGFVADNSIPVAAVLHSRMWGQLYCGKHTDDGYVPQDDDYSIIDYLTDCLGASNAEIEKHVNAFVAKHFREHPAAETYRIFLGHAARSLTRHAQYAIPYTNPRGMSYGWPEAASYASEWRNDAFVTGNDGHYFQNPVESYRDYILPKLRELVRHGFSGIYFDNTFDSVNEDEVMGPVVEYELDRYRHHHTILEMRQLVKRTATMLYTEGKLIEDRPFLVLHTTNCVPLPLMAFASHQLDWEAYYGQSDYQERFSNGYILAESTGLQSGCVPQVLLDSDKTPENNQATALALLLPYCLLDIYQSHTGPTEATAKTINAIRNYGYGEPGVEVFPCYDTKNPLRVSDKVRAALVRRENSALVLVGDFDSDGQFTLDFSALGYANPVALDALTGETLGETTQLTIAIPHHRSRVILVADGMENAQAALAIIKASKPPVMPFPNRQPPNHPLYEMELSPVNLLDIDPRQNIVLIGEGENRAMLVSEGDSFWLDLLPEVCRGQNISVQFQYRSDTEGAVLEANLRYAPGEIYCEGTEGPRICCSATSQWQTAHCAMQFPAELEEPLILFHAKGGTVQVKDLQVFLGEPPEAVPAMSEESPAEADTPAKPTPENPPSQTMPSGHQELPPEEIQRLIDEAGKPSETLVKPPEPTAEELQAVAIPELAEPLQMTAMDGNVLQVTAKLRDGSSLTAEFTVPPLEIREAKGEYHSELPVLDENNRGGMFPNQLISCYGGLLEDSVQVSSANNNTKYILNKDFRCYSQRSHIGAIQDGAIQGPVVIDYRYRWQRIDSVTLLNNQLLYRQGVESRITPPQPPLQEGEVRLGNVYLSPDTTELTEGNLYPISETRYPVHIQPVTEELLPRTMAKLRNGEPLTILAWGDSITAITYEMPGWKTARWQEQFAAGLRARFPKANIRVITEAWGGHNSNDYLEPAKNPAPGRPHNYQERVLDVRPDLIVSEWSNDRWMPYSLLNSPQSNYYRMLHDFRAIDAEWIIIVPPYGGSTARFEAAAQKNIIHESEYLSFLRQFAPANGIPLADVSARYDRLWRQGIPLLALGTYGVHPHRDGLQIFAQALLDLFPEK